MTGSPWIWGMVAISAAAASVAGWWLPGPWFDGLTKPGWAVPGWALAVIWPAVTVLVAVTGQRLAAVPAARAAWRAWALQLGLVSLWTLFFFGLGRLDLTLLLTLALTASIAAVIALAWRPDRTSGLLFVPYLVWALYSTALVGALWASNGPAP